MSENLNLALTESLVPSNSTAYGLPPNSYTSQRLKHASPEHLHLTTRRFFIGPIPEGWLNSHRKAWYKRRLALSNSSQDTTFDAAVQQRRRSTTIDLRHPSLAARIAVSFPQPLDVYNVPSTPDASEEAQEGTSSEGETDEDIEPQDIAPVATHDVAQTLGIADGTDIRQPKLLPVPPSDLSHGDVSSSRRPTLQQRTSQRAESFQTAPETASRVSTRAIKEVEEFEQTPEDSQPIGVGSPSISSRTGAESHLHAEELITSPDQLDSSSKTALLADESPAIINSKNQAEGMKGGSEVRPISRRVMTHETPAPMNGPESMAPFVQRESGVRFKVAEEVADRRRRIGKRAGYAKDRVSHRVSRRSTLQEGTVVKMEKMLVRVDITMQQLAPEFDENESMKTETRAVEKWGEFMVVARKSSKADDEDFRLQFYKTRVIPEIENQDTRKKPSREIKLLPHSTHVNLYSSLDKTIVIWHPHRKGTRIYIMKPVSTAHAVEWHAFLRAALGSPRPNNLQVNVPDLDVTLHIENPFQGFDSISSEAADDETFLIKAAEAEHAVAGKIISQSIKMLERDAEWSDVLLKWSETAKMGLAWKRYDRLEWVYGINELKMFGSMAMQQTHDLELRPKQHYPTQACGKKGVLHEEPAPVEGFLIRLTSQKGLHKQFGKAFFKRLYFSTHDKYLFFNRPAKATPPHPPRLTTITGTNIPSSQEIVEKTPMTFDVEPFQTEDGAIKWLKPNHRDIVTRSNADAMEESERNMKNLIESDGYIDMCHIVKVRKIKWGAVEVDDALESGEDVDFHADVDNTALEDGATSEIDDDRIFELVLANDLVVRLQAYSKKMRTVWIDRLRKLVKYWKLRTAADVHNLKAVRQANLNNLSIDEEMEAILGQFAHKWEVSRSEASPEIYNMCRLTACRTITMAGLLYRKPKLHSSFQRCNVILAGGQMLTYQATVRKTTGQQVSHIHSEKQQIIDLKDCYVYSGLIVEDDLLYQNRTFDANQPGMLATTPRVYLDDGWTAADVDVMTCFVVWMSRSKSWFRSVATHGASDAHAENSGRRSKLKRVTQLGVPGRGMVFKCRSRAERDLWVTSVAAEIEAAMEKAHSAKENSGHDDLAEVRLEH